MEVAVDRIDVSVCIDIRKALEIVVLSENTWVNVTIFYEDADIPSSVYEPFLEIWKHNGTWHMNGWESWKGLEPTENKVSANIIEFGSLFIPLAGENVPPTTVKEIARAAAIWRPPAPSPDMLATEGLAFARKVMAYRRLTPKEYKEKGANENIRKFGGDSGSGEPTAYLYDLTHDDQVLIVNQWDFREQHRVSIRIFYNEERDELFVDGLKKEIDWWLRE